MSFEAITATTVMATVAKTIEPSNRPPPERIGSSGARGSTRLASTGGAQRSAAKESA